jgi:hypothetical protein
MKTLIDPNQCPVGKIKTFGEFGPAYQVGQPVRETEEGDWMVSVTLVVSGEKAEYPLSRILNDPEAR